MENQKIKISDLRKVSGIGDKTIERIKEQLLQSEEKNQEIGIKNETKINIELNKFYIANSVDFMKQNMQDNFVDLTVTSPPYDDLRKYNGFEFDYKAMLSELYRVTKEGGVVVWIVGDKTHKGSETGTSFKHALYAKKIGFNLHDTMIYAKNNPIPLTHNRYEQQFEYMFVFSKRKPKTFNPIMKENIHKGKSKTGTHRKKTDELEQMNKLEHVKDESIENNIWFYSVNKGATTKDLIAHKHPAIFPEEMAQDHILSWSNEGDIVFDPMCGSGTACKMAYFHNRKFIGIDMSAEYINDICIPRLKEYGDNK